MTYKKPEIVAKSFMQKSYVAGCPVNRDDGRRSGGVNVGCRKCERSGS